MTIMAQEERRQEGRQFQFDLLMFQANDQIIMPTQIAFFIAGATMVLTSFQIPKDNQVLGLFLLIGGFLIAIFACFNIIDYLIRRRKEKILKIAKLYHLKYNCEQY